MGLRLSPTSTTRRCLPPLGLLLCLMFHLVVSCLPYGEVLVEKVGKFGEVSKKTLKTFEIAQPVFLFIINLEKLYTLNRRDTRYKHVSPFPSVKRDLGFIVEKSVEAGAMVREIQKAGGQFLKDVEIFDLFEGEKIGMENKNIAFALTYSSEERTLESEEVDASVKAIIKAIEKAFNGKLREF